MKILTSPINDHKLEIDTHNDLIGMFVDQLGAFDVEVVLELKRQLDRTGSRVLVDVGANVGTVCLPLLEAIPDLTVIAIEPIPENLEKLRSNLAPYQDRVHIVDKAVSDKEDFVIMERFENNMGASRVADTGESFECSTMDSILEEINVVSGYVMKIDVELHEPEVFRGMKRILPSAIVSEANRMEDLKEQMESQGLRLQRLFMSDKELLNGRKIGNWTALWHD